MEFALYYTVTAILAYLLADWILDRIEIAYGKRFKYRNYIFFILIFALAYLLSLVIVPGAELSAPEQHESQGVMGRPGK